MLLHSENRKRSSVSYFRKGYQQLNKLFSGDVLVNDALNGTVCDQLCQSCIDGAGQLAALGQCDCIFLGDVFGVEDLQAFVGSNEVLGGLVVDNNAVNLAGGQSQNGIGTGLETLDGSQAGIFQIPSGIQGLRSTPVR